MLRHWERQTLVDLLAAHDLARVPEQPLVHDGWSGAGLTRLVSPDGPAFILKRDSLTRNWIARATLDDDLREAVLAARDVELPAPLLMPYLGAAVDGDGAAILMPDLTGVLLDWEQVVDAATLDRILGGIARLHASPWAPIQTTSDEAAWPWCPLRERLLLLARPSAERYRAEGLSVGDRFLAGWDAFDRRVPPAARHLIDGLAADPEPLLAALGRLPATGLHGDLKLANVGLMDDGRIVLIDWGMMLFAPIAVELGWFLVANSGTLPEAPDAVLERYRRAAGSIEVAESRPGGPEAQIVDWKDQVDLAWIVGLLLRGWRKGLDAEDGIILPSGVSAADDLAAWCERAVASAGRRLGNLPG